MIQEHQSPSKPNPQYPRRNMSLSHDIDIVGEGRNRLLLAKQAQLEQLQAEISSLRSIPLSTSPSSSSNNGRIQKHQHVSQCRNNMSRSSSNNGTAPMSRQQSADRTETLQPRSRNFSQRSATSMTRGSSKGSASQQINTVPFTSTGVIPPPLYTRPESQATGAWPLQEQSTRDYHLSQQPYHGQQQQWLNPPRTSGLEQVCELDDLTDPSEYLRSMNAPFFVTASIPISPRYSTKPIQLTSTYNVPASSPSTSDMLTSATTFTEPMSRQDSLCSEPFIEKVQMMKFGSHSSYSPEVTLGHDFYDQVNSFSPVSQICSSEKQSQTLAGAGASYHLSIPHSLPLQSSLGVEMEKSHSSESNSSSTSARKQRNLARLQDQNRLAIARPLVPKGGSADNIMSRENSSYSMARSGSKDGSQDNKVAISTKSGYQRPQHDRVYCNRCDNHSEGFRGPHELSRHIENNHSAISKKYICVEPAEGLRKLDPIVPLSRCKACSQQKKYGAYYNAAAHLRRAHFNPKPKGRGSKSAKHEDAEKRGGKGGGDLPVMDDLKCWMMQVEVKISANEYADDESTPGNAEDQVGNNNHMEMIYSQQAMPTMSNNDFEVNFLDENSMLDTSLPKYLPTINYPATIGNDFFENSNINMQIDFTDASQQHSDIQQAMFNGLNVQNNIPSFTPDMYQQVPMFYELPHFAHSQALENQIFADSDAVHYYQ